MTSRTRAEGVLLAMTLIWASTFVVGKLVMRDMTPMQMISIRFVLATIVVTALFFRSIFPLHPTQVFKGVILGLFLFLGFVVQTIGLTITTASKSSFITGMMVVFVPLLQVVVNRRAPKLGNILGVVVVSAGLWFLTSPSGASFNAGDALTLIAALSFAVYIVYLDIVSHEMNASQLTFLQVATNALLSMAAIALFENPPLTMSAGSAAGLLYLTIFATIMTVFLQTKYQKDTNPTRATIIFTLEPVWTAIAAAIVLGEVIGWLGVLGGGLIIAGVLVSELSDAIPFLKKSIEPVDS